VSRADVLVDAEWVDKRPDDPQIVLVEVDEDTSLYDINHIRGAVRLDWRKDLQDPVRRDFIDRPGFEALLSRRGIGNDHTVVRLLDGGRKKWELDGRELSTEPVTRPATTYVAKPADGSIRAFRDEVVAAIGTGTIVDVRSPEEFAGRIVAPALYGAAGVTLDGRDAIVYCRIGERSAHTWFVLHELLGLPNVKNYDGSWVEYGSLVAVPIEK
jgi:thiosulfate/3-mercaptopyruvate sulfurtransferase